MDLEQDILEIKKRNACVEENKAWEVSWSRRITIALFTYAVASIWLILIDNTQPFLNAFVPTGGYVLSTLSLPIVRRWWGKNLKKHDF